MEKEKLEKIITKAYELSKASPDLNDDYKLVVFEVIFKKLLKKSLLEDTPKKKPPKPKLKSPTKKEKITIDDKFDSNKEKLQEDIETLKKIDRTKYTKMSKLKKTLDRSIYLLKIAKEDFEIEGLISSQISQILKDRFQIEATGNAISMALSKAIEIVNRNEYRISEKGQQPMLYSFGDAAEKYILDVFEKLDKK